MKNKAIEIIILALMFYVMLAWVQWDYNPQHWHWITRGIYVVMLLLVMIAATYPGTKKPQPVNGGGQGVVK